MPCKISATYQYPLLYGQGNLPVRSDVLAWLWLKIMALAWLFMALAHEIPSQSHGTWLWPAGGSGHGPGHVTPAFAEHCSNTD